MRIRTVKPEMWADGKVVRLSDAANLLFIALLNQADDEGRLKNDPKEIECHAPRFWERSASLILELEKAELVTIYGPEGQFLEILNFSKHQVIDRKRPSQIPSPNARRTLADYSTQGKEGKGKEGKGKEGKGKEGKGNDISAEQPAQTVVVKTPQNEKQPSPNPIHKLVEVWRWVIDLPEPEWKSWNKANFGRCAKQTKLLLEIFHLDETATNKELEPIRDCMSEVYEKMKKAGLSCTLETVVKHAHEWRGENGHFNTDN